MLEFIKSYSFDLLNFVDQEYKGDFCGTCFVDEGKPGEYWLKGNKMYVLVYDNVSNIIEVYKVV